MTDRDTAEPREIAEFRTPEPWIGYTIVLATGQRVIVHARTERAARKWLLEHHPEFTQSRYGVNR